MTGAGDSLTSIIKSITKCEGVSIFQQQGSVAHSRESWFFTVKISIRTFIINNIKIIALPWIISQAEI